MYNNLHRLQNRRIHTRIKVLGSYHPSLDLCGKSEKEALSPHRGFLPGFFLTSASRDHQIRLGVQDLTPEKYPCYDYTFDLFPHGSRH